MVTSGIVLSLARCDVVAPGRDMHRERSTLGRGTAEKLA